MRSTAMRKLHTDTPDCVLFSSGSAVNRPIRHTLLSMLSSPFPLYLVFQYADFEWGTDSEQLFKQSSLKFDEKDLGQGDESSTKTYESKEKFSLENAESNMDLEFSDGQLSQVSFTFDIEQDANTWIQKEVDELNSLYGGGIATGLGNQIYQWQGEQDTVLQLTAFTEGDESATVILSVASMEYSIGS